ncbi:hypothetical protein MO973_06740 [Paenibacillus sp. TRM 82003]|nr:hypothetical protein [Paenibacillus sp. TRM 82003]
MEYSHFPNKKNTYFIKSVAVRYPTIRLDLKRERKAGYSIFIPEFPNKRWMMVDIHAMTVINETPHLYVCIDVHRDDFTNERLSSLLPLPLNKRERTMVTSCWMNENNDAVHLKFCDDEYRKFDFESDAFVAFLELTRLSFIKRQTRGC